MNILIQREYFGSIQRINLCSIYFFLLNFRFCIQHFLHSIHFDILQCDCFGSTIDIDMFIINCEKFPEGVCISNLWFEENQLVLSACLNLILGHFVSFFICASNINKCTALPSACHVNARCTNGIVSYLCACNPWYTGNGKTCKGMLIR